ncbi:MAG: twitching motility protein PilT [Lachnospiraceae bacterium]|nr:twitching motility protein PilT [Lachnospiraceae bacterium]
MVQLVIGEKGKGKTKVLLDRANEEIQNAKGNVVFLDKSSKHMYELNNRVRLIDVSGFDISNSDRFLGFINGIISQDHDLEQMYFDNFLSIAACNDNFEEVIEEIEKISSRTNVSFIISMSKTETELSDTLRERVIVAL